jgi:ArsR family transcriptional regulator|tara:strand:+ start:1087 stop:1407 length:321 start_codon:yes stop_codon:yes gene_type:complete
MTTPSFELYEKFFKTLSNETRFQIIKLLMKGPKSVMEISHSLNFEQSRVSHNLRRLECCGFINLKSKGKQRIYSIDQTHMKPIMLKIDKYIGKYNKRLKECHDMKK